MRKKFNKGDITYIQLRKYANIAIYQLINNKKEDIIGFQCVVIKRTEYAIKDYDNQTFISPSKELYDYDAEIIPSYKDALHVYTEILKNTIREVGKGQLESYIGNKP